MSILNKVATTALSGLAVLGFASSAFAPVVAAPREGSFEAHGALVEEIGRRGVRVLVNDESCADDGGGFAGYYSGVDRLIVICQENGVAGGPMVAWTEEDLDTLRHEAQHFIQDCMVGERHDHLLGNVYVSPVELAREVIGDEAVVKIITVYRDHGANDHVLLLELEAFSVAALNVPLDQIRDLKNYCSFM